MRSFGVAHGGVFPAHVPLVLLCFFHVAFGELPKLIQVDPALPSDSVGLGHARWPYAVLLFSELGREFASRTETERFFSIVWT